MTDENIKKVVAESQGWDFDSVKTSEQTEED